MISKSRLAVATLLVVVVGACGPKATTSPPKYALECQMTSDDGKALGGVTVDIGRRRVGTTSADGTLRAELSGVEGQTLPVAVSCPEGFANPESLSPLRLTHTRRVNLSGYQPLHVEAVCRRNTRDIVVIVRAQGGAGLPLQVEGRPAGVTDADGIAHVLVRADRATPSLSVSLDTSSRQDLKPRCPSRVYELAGNDAVLIFDQTLVATPKPVFHGGPAKSRKRIPYRVD